MCAGYSVCVCVCVCVCFGCISRCCIESLGERDVESLFTQDTATTSLASVTTRLSQESGGSTIHTVSQDMGIGPVDSPDEGIEIEDFEDDLIW